MSAEIEDRDAAAHPKDFQEITKLKRSKIRYPRAFLLTFANFDVCKRLPPGAISPSVLLEMANDKPRDLHESWRRFGDFSVEGKSEKNSPEAIERSSVLGQTYSLKPPRRNGESNSPEARNSDAPQYKARVLDQSDKETLKIGPDQLRRSANPYRPPHCHQASSAKFEEESRPKKHRSFQDLHVSIRKETCPRASNVSALKNQEINLPGECVNEPSSYLSNDANIETDTGSTPNLPVCATEALGSSLKYSSKKESAILDIREDDKPISDIHFSHFCCFAALHSGENGSAERTKRIDDSKPCGFSFFDEFDFPTPSADEVTIATTAHLTGIMASDVAMQTEFYGVDDNELSFEDVWSEVSAILRFEREMDLTLAAEYGETAELEILVSLAYEGSDTSIPCPSSCEPIGGYKCGNGSASDADAEICLPDDDNCDDNANSNLDEHKSGDNANSDAGICLPDEQKFYDDANSDDDICWPDENSLISIDDMIAHDSRGSRLTSDPPYGYANGSGIADTSPHKKRSAPRHTTVSPFRGNKAPLPYQKFSALQTYQSPWTTTAVIPPLHYQGAHMALQMPVMTPGALIPSGVNWYSCTNMLRQPSTEECAFIHQYSLWQQPTAFLIAHQC